jgi:hypothetical protein
LPQRSVGASNIVCFPTDFEIVFLLDEHTQTFPEHRMVVDDQNATFPGFRLVRLTHF